MPIDDFKTVISPPQVSATVKQRCFATNDPIPPIAKFYKRRDDLQEP